MQCVVPNCHNDSRQTHRGITYHTFPTEQTLRAAWLEALHIAAWEPEEHSAVCSNHFQHEDLLESGSGGRAVRAGAVPVFDVLVCRVCFATYCKLYRLTGCKILSTTFETLTGLLIENKDNLPPYLCSECARRLLDCARFKKTSLRAHSNLLEIVKDNGFVTLELVQSVRGIQMPHNLSQADYDLDNELTKKENIYTDGQAGTMHLLDWCDVAHDSIKIEKRDLINQDIINAEDTNNDMASKFVLPEDLLEENFKRENIEIKVEFNPEIHNDEHTTYDKVCISMLPEDIAQNDVKVENIDMINEYITHIENTTNVMMRTSSLPEFVAVHGIKVEYDNESHQNNANKESVDVNIEPGHAIVGEDYSSNDSLPLAEARQKAKLNIEGSPQADVDTRREPAADGGVLVKDKLSCDVCPYRTNSELQLSSHVKAHAAAASCNYNTCSYVADNKRNLTHHDRVHTGEEPYSCDVCGKIFNSKGDLNKHLPIHSDEKPYTFNVGNKELHLKTCRTEHLRTYPAHVKSYTCYVCNKEFTRKDHLTLHLRTHSGEKPYACNVCNKGFTRKDSLTLHLRTHSGVKPFSCEVCFKDFSRKDSLTLHLRTHAVSVSDDKLITKGILNSHAEIHCDNKQYICDVCNKTFYKKVYLKSHLRIHSGVKPYSCGVCNKKFTKKSDLTRHSWTHSVKKPYSCEVCNKAFTRKAYFTNHLRTHAGV